MASTLPERARRLFSTYDDCDRITPGNLSLVLARMLEYGDSDDLAWLMRRVPEHELRQWLAAHGRQQLSRRSHAFWCHLLTPHLKTSDLPENPLWPL